MDFKLIIIWPCGTIYQLNNKGLKIDPCGTLHDNLATADQKFPTDIKSVLLAEMN